MISNRILIVFIFLLSISCAQTPIYRCPSTTGDGSTSGGNFSDQNSCKALISEAPTNIKLDFLISNEELKRQRVELVNQINTVPDLTHGLTIAAEVDEKYQTIRLFDRKAGRILKGAKARCLLLHGSGSTRSRSFAMRGILRHFSEPSFGENGTINNLRKYKNSIPMACEAIDMPGHGVGPDLKGFQNIDYDVDWLASYLYDMKRQTPDLPLFVLTRSSQLALTSLVNQKYPGLLSWIIGMSPTWPGEADILKAGFDTLYKIKEKEKFEINLEGLLWVEKILLNTHWDKTSFGNKDVLLMTGGLDDQVVEYERKKYIELAQKNKKIRYQEFPKASHDILNTSKEFREVGLDAYRYIFDFIHDVMKSPEK
jgi:hypothetical protein